MRSHRIKAYLRLLPIPTLHSGNLVIIGNLSSKQRESVRETIAAARARLVACGYDAG